MKRTNERAWIRQYVNKDIDNTDRLDDEIFINGGDEMVVVTKLVEKFGDLQNEADNYVEDVKLFSTYEEAVGFLGSILEKTEEDEWDDFFFDRKEGILNLVRYDSYPKMRIFYQIHKAALTKNMDQQEFYAKVDEGFREVNKHHDEITETLKAVAGEN